MHPLGVAARPGSIGARFEAARQHLTTAAVTGTNGKTTTTSMIAAIVAASGEPSARLTTVGAWIGGDKIEADTPTLEFLALVEAAALRGVRTIAVEMTSKALASGLAHQWPARVAVFTNLTRDHLDMHKSFEAYLAAKAQLFMGVAAGGTAILNADDSSSQLLAEVIRPGVEVRRYSLRDPGVTLAAREVLVHRGGTRVTLAPSELADRLGGRLELAVVGSVHAENALGAALAADALGYAPDAILRGLSGFSGVAGRFQIVGHAPLVAVDYAHTPDGLERTLIAARGLVAGGGRLLCVFGCGGDRDRGKRPEMGAIAHRLADVCVLTNDNPRSEAPEAIAADIRAGAAGDGASWLEVLDRGLAIERVIADAGPGDVIVIAGKGHESIQEIAGQKLPFSDAEVARDALERHRSTR